MKRRNFLQQSSLASTSMLVPNFLKRFTPNNPSNSRTEKILVVIQLSGGNDGLNTIIPFRNDLYYKSRPTLGIQQNEVLKVSDELGFNPALASLRSLLDEGEMSVINSVGYPNPDRSHFRAMDIWHTASSSDEYLSTGWLGRYLDYNCPNPHTALEIDGCLSLALKGASKSGVALKRKEHTFAEDLRQIAELIAADTDTRIYYVNLGGFDTHAGQRETQDRLLKIYAEGINAFIKDLKAHHLFNDVMIFTFSEFGRQLKENASGGTDHGTANNVFLFNGNLKKAGFYNNAPDLTHLDKGGLKYEIDFRSIYATLLDDWLNHCSISVLNQKFSRLNII